MITDENQHLFNDNEEIDNEEIETNKIETNKIETHEIENNKIETEIETKTHEIENDEKNEFDIKELIEKWLELDEEIRKMNDELKDLKLEKKQYEIYILEIMDNTNKQIIKSNEIVIKKNIKQSKGSIKEELIVETLSEILKDSVKAHELFQLMIKKLPIKEIISLKKENDKMNKKSKKNI